MASTEIERTGGVDPTSLIAVADRKLLNVTVPVLNVTVAVPRELIPYYVGLGAMVALELIEWPVALIVAAGHTLAALSHNQTIRELGEGLETGA